MSPDSAHDDGIPKKRCPFCAELIPDTERTCRFCHEALDPALRGKYEGGAAYWDGDYLRVPLGGFIRRSHCIVCGKRNAPDLLHWKFRYIRWWHWAMLIPLNYLALILIAIAHETQEVDVPVCRGCEDRWRLASRVFRLYAFLMVVLMPVLFGLVGHTLDRRDGAPYGVLAGFLVWCWGLFGLHALWVRKCQAVARKITPDSALLRLPNASLVQTAWEEDK